MTDFFGDNSESFGAGPPSPSSISVSSPHRRDRQSFLWSRVNLSHESILPPPRSGAASVVVQGKLYMFGVSMQCIAKTRPRVGEEGKHDERDINPSKALNVSI